jgi:hypothetical protein
MDDSLRVVCEMNHRMWGRLKNALEDLSEEERHRRPVPEANTINVIVRHLRIEAEWHVDSLQHGAPMPHHSGVCPSGGDRCCSPGC